MREPLQLRRQRVRAEQRARVAAMVKVPISRETRARTRPPVGRALAMALAVIFAIAVHGTVIGIGWWKSQQPKPKKDEVKIVVREPPPPPPKPPEPPPPPPPKAEEPPPAPPPPKKVASAPPPPPPKADTPPPPVPPQAPKRVVGLSMEGTAGEGGDGPAFATGNTLDGQTDTKAVDPKLVDKNPPKDAPIGVPTAPPPANKVATNVPGQGVVNGGGTKKKEVKPKFPEVLRAQGIEADVVLRVTFDATGKVTKVDLVTPAPQKEFNDAAVAAAYQEEYVPATRNGVAISKTIQFTTKFRLED